MAPIRRAGKSYVLCTATPANLAQGCVHKLLRVGYKYRGFANFGHGRSNQMRLYALNSDTVGLKFGAERCGPLLKKGFAARVRC